MKLDSDAQRNLLLALLKQVPVQTTIEGMLGGLRPEVRELLMAIQRAEIEPAKDDSA